jgi:hypothetical protein
MEAAGRLTAIYITERIPRYSEDAIEKIESEG